jgi:hypothetical protein
MALVQPQRPNILLQNALAVYLQHSLQQIQRLHGELSMLCNCTSQWRSAVTTAEELMKYLRNCIADQNVRMLTVYGAHAFAAVSRLENALRWSMQVPGSTSFYWTDYDNRQSWYQHSAHFHINALVALRSNDSELASIWQVAAQLVDGAVNDKYKIRKPSKNPRDIDGGIPNLPDRLKSLAEANKRAPESASLALRRLEERHLRVKWAYDVVDAVTKIISEPGKQNVSTYRSILSDKSKLANNIATAYGVAAQCEEKASCHSSIGIGAVWRTASQQLTTAIAEGLPENVEMYASMQGPQLWYNSYYFYATAVARLAQALDIFAEEFRGLDLPGLDPRAVPQRLRALGGASARCLDELVSEVTSSPLLVSPRGDMWIVCTRLERLIADAHAVLHGVKTLVAINAQAESFERKSGPANAIAARLLRTASGHRTALLEDGNAEDAELHRYRASRLVSLACETCPTMSDYFRNAAQANALGRTEAAEAWTKAGVLMLAIVERAEKELEQLTRSNNFVHSNVHKQRQEYAVKRYAGLARVLESGTAHMEEVRLLRTSCALWESTIHTEVCSFKLDMAVRYFDANLNDMLSLYADGPKDCDAALLSVATLIGINVPPPDASVREALLAARTRLAESVCDLAALCEEATIAIIHQSLSDCMQMIPKTAHELQIGRVGCAEAHGALLATCLLRTRAKLAGNVLQEKVCMESAGVRQIVLSILGGTQMRYHICVEVRTQVADALLAQARGLTRGLDVHIGAHAAQSPVPSKDVASVTEPPVSGISQTGERDLVGEIGQAYFSAAASAAASEDSAPAIEDERGSKEIRKTHEKLSQLYRQVAEALCELADLSTATALSAEERARQLTAREYEVRALRESVRLYQRIVGALQRGQNITASYWKQAAIIRELPAARPDPARPTTLPLRQIPPPGLTEDVQAAGAAHYESAALALEAGDETRATVLLFAAKQTMENMAFLKVKAPIPPQNIARVQANMKILSSVAALAVGDGGADAEQRVQAVRQELAALRQAGTAVWSAELAERYEALHRQLLANSPSP